MYTTWCGYLRVGVVEIEEGCKISLLRIMLHIAGLGESFYTANVSERFHNMDSTSISSIWFRPSDGYTSCQLQISPQTFLDIQGCIQPSRLRADGCLYKVQHNL